MQLQAQKSWNVAILNMAMIVDCKSYLTIQNFERKTSPIFGNSHI